MDNLFGGGREAAGNDMYKQMQQGWNMDQNMMNPYIQRGNDAYQNYINALNQGKNPQDLYNQFASSYKESPEALAQQQVGQKSANQANAASGMLGSGAAQTEAANLAQSVRSQDFDKYMQNMFGIRNQYLGGQSNIEGQGFQASNSEADRMQKYFEDMAKAKAARDEGRAQGQSGFWGTAGGLVGGIAGSLFGGPAGGAAGGAAGNWFGNLFGGGGGDEDGSQMPSNDQYNQFL